MLARIAFSVSHASQYGQADVRMVSDVEVGDRQSVLLDELAARLDLVPHEGREDIVGGHRVLDPHLHEPSCFRIDGRLPQLLRVHLAQALVALDGLTLACLVEQPLHPLLEGADVLPIAAAGDVRTLADEPGQGARQVRDALVLGGLEEFPRQVLAAGRAMLGLVHDHSSRVAVVRGAQFDAIGTRAVGERVEPLIEVVRPATQPVRTIEARQRHFRHVDQLLEQPLVVALRPALHDRLHLHVLARQQLECRSRQRRRFAIDVQAGVLQGAVEQQLIELGVVLDVGLLLAALDFVQRRLRDVDVPALDELGHLPVKECQQQSPYVASVNIGIGIVAADTAHAGDEILVSFYGKVVDLAIAGRNLFNGGDWHRHQVPVDCLKAAGGPGGLQVVLKNRGPWMVLPDRLQPTQILLGANANAPIAMFGLTGKAPHRTNNSIRLVFANGRNNTERAQGVDDAARDVVRRCREDYPVPRYGAVAQQVAAQKRDTQGLRNVKYEIGAPFGDGTSVREAEDVLPRQGRYPVHQLELIATLERGV